MKILLIGSAWDEFVQWATEAARTRGAEVVGCEDIYAASAWAAKNHPAGQFIAVGSIEELGREGGRFFEKALHRETACWCLAGRKSNRRLIGFAQSLGACIIYSRTQFEEKLSEAEFPAPLAEKFVKDEYRISRAELDALLDM